MNPKVMKFEMEVELISLKLIISVKVKEIYYQTNLTKTKVTDYA